MIYSLLVCCIAYMYLYGNAYSEPLRYYVPCSIAVAGNAQSLILSDLGSRVYI